MGKKQKTGKNRLDKYYHLAKEQGYRARSAFKLIQMAQRNDLFSNCSVLLDLCAAPGGWLQVAQKNMPVASHIVGVDLAPIRPIHSVVTIQADITSQRCRSLLKSEFKNTQVDLVLHDGAPNVGTSWAHDAYAQNELVLHAARLASEFLRRGGTFVTKVFRSQDYLSILWMCQQLFLKVIATKPSSSRNISAELFIICLDYKKPEKVDQRFFDPRHIFINTEQPTHITSDVHSTDTKRSLSELVRMSNQKNRGGYNEGDDYRESSVTEFLYATSPAEFLVSRHKFTFPEHDPQVQFILKNPLTTPEIMQCCEDLKVLSKRDFMVLIKWRKKILKQISEKETRSLQKASETDLNESEHTEDEDWDQKLEAFKKEKQKQLLKEARDKHQKINKLLLKKKMSLGAFNPVEENPELFRLEESRILQEENKILDAGNYYKYVERLDCPSSHSGSEDEHENNLTGSTIDIENNFFLDESQRLEEMAQNLDVWESETKRHHAEKEAKRQLKRVKKTRRQLAYAAWNKELSAITEKVESRSLKEPISSENSSDVDEASSFHIQESDDNIDITKYEESKSKSNLNSLDNSIISLKSPSALLRAARWFDQPLFKQAGIVLEEEQVGTEDENIKALSRNDLTQKTSVSFEEDDSDASILEMSESELPKMPLTKKQKCKELQRRRRKEESAESSLKNSRSRDQKIHSDGEPVHTIQNIKLLDQLPTDNTPDLMSFDKNKDTTSNGVKHEKTHDRNALYLNRPKTAQDLLQVQTIGCLLAKKRTRMDLIDGAYNRYAFDDDEGVPDWFLRDEEERMRPELPVTKELMKEYRAKLAEISRRPIRKVLEAQQRKKQKLKRRLEKTKKKAELIASSAEYNETSKTSSIRKLVKKTMREFEKPKKYVTSRKKGGVSILPKRKGESDGVVRVVDRRLKKDKRGKLKRNKKRSRR